MLRWPNRLEGRGEKEDAAAAGVTAVQVDDTSPLFALVYDMLEYYLAPAF
jgi:hypothetical protein